MVSRDLNLFGQTNFRNQLRQFGIKRDDRRRHMYLIGKTGMGKSTVLENLIIQDIRNGEGLAVVDPHGDLVEKVIQYIPEYRAKDVVYFNPSDQMFPIAFNVLEITNPEQQHLIASGLVGVFKKQFADSWGPRLEYLLRNAILTMLDYPQSTMLGILRVLADKDYRDKVLPFVKDPVVRKFWTDEYSKYPDRFQAEAVAPIQNKVGQFLSNFLIRNIVGQPHSTIDMRDIMDNRKILLLNLAKGRIGEDTSALMGAMMITKIQLAAMERIDMPESQRKDFYLYVDEFQNFATDSFSNILSEARKYRLCLILAHQYIEQLDERVAAAIFGNVGTLVVFRVGANDAEFLAKEFAPIFTEEDLVNLAKYDFYLKLMIDGIASDPFSAMGMPPLSDEEKIHNVDRIIEHSRTNYSRPRAEVEDAIMRWSGDMPVIDPTPIPSAFAPASVPAPTPPPAVMQAAVRITPLVSPAPTPERSVVTPVAPSSPTPASSFQRQAAAVATPQQLEVSVNVDEAVTPKVKKEEPPPATIVATCANCGDSTMINFQPDGQRPVYCKSCLKGVREQRRQKKEQEMAATAVDGGEPVLALPDTELEQEGLSLSALSARNTEYQKKIVGKN